MSNLIVVAFNDEQSAFKMRDRLVQMQGEYLLELEDAVVATRNDKGKVVLHQAVNLTAAGAVGGTFWGMLVGLLFLNPLVGAAVGAGTGALSGALSDIGINDDFMRNMADKLETGKSVLFVLIRNATGDKVLDQLREFNIHGDVLQTSLSKDQEEKLRQVLHSAQAAAQSAPAAAGASAGGKAEN